MDVLGPAYALSCVAYMFPPMLFLFCIWGGTVDVGEEAKDVAVADFGAVRRPASRCDRLVRGVGTPLSLASVEDLIASNDRGLMF